MRLAASYKKGFVLLGVLLVSMAFIIIIIPIISWTANEYSWSMRSFMRLKALNLADAGAESAIWEIFHNGAAFTTWQGTNPKTLALNNFKDNDNLSSGDIEVIALNTSPGNYLITSTGHVPASPNRKVKKTVKVKVFPHSLFNNAVFGKTSVSITGNAGIDSYDSSVGLYSSLNAGDDADIGSDGSLSIGGSGYVSGDVFIGPDGSVTGDTSSHVSGETFYSGNDVELDPVTVPDYLSSLSSMGVLSLGSTDELLLPGGLYRYDGISLTSKSVLTIGGGSKIYVEGGFSITAQAQVITGPDVDIYIGGNGSFTGQGIVNTSGYPDNLSIYGVGSGTSFSFSGTSDFYGTIYAPWSGISLSGNSAFFGAVVGDTVSMTGSMKFHYDEVLSRVPSGTGYDIAYWQED